MECNIKMAVTPDLSERVQEIVIKNGGGWQYIKSKETQLKDKQYLFIDKNKDMSYVIDKTIFEKDKFKEISAYDFIASQGEQEWLPKYNEKALFSDDKEEWVKRQFKSYLPNYSSPFITEGNMEYRYCKPLSKEVSFIQFLKDNNAYEAYMENSKIENQRWNAKEKYKTLEEIKTISSNHWTGGAFNWEMQPERLISWCNIHSKWLDICKNNEVVWE